MKKIFLLVGLLFLATGCGKLKTGTYIYNIENLYFSSLKLYDGGICEWNFNNVIDTANGECVYNYTDNEIKITYNPHSSIEYETGTTTVYCTYKRNTIECEDRIYKRQ